MHLIITLKEAIGVIAGVGLVLFFLISLAYVYICEWIEKRKAKRNKKKLADTISKMRPATPEEIKMANDYIKSISTPVNKSNEKDI